MRRALALVLSFVAAAAMAQNLTITPTTTYATETGVNTSEPAGFTTQTDGNLGGANISKVDTHTLLYPGFNGKIYAHVVGWFGGSNHENIGYNSSDPAVVKAQLTDMTSRGIDGIIHVWYGPGTNISELEAQQVSAQAPNYPGFTFAIMIDKGAIQWNSCYPSCSATQALINLTTYVANTYFSSPSYLRINGRPVITNFDIDSAYSVDWNQVAASTPGNPIFLFQNNSGFTHVQTGGAYSWVMPSDSNYGLDYLSSFYSTGMSYPSEATFGATYKGFNDTLASWTMNRIQSQQCGQTWLSTFNQINSQYNSTNQLPYLQLVTWDDYEEGTEIETGIDNCVSVSASLSGTVLNWAISGGSESTIDHYTVFISADGQNLMSLGDFAAGTHSVDIASFNPAAGTYTLYVKAVGKPSIANKMSNASTLTISTSNAGSSVTVTPSSGMAPLAVTATASSTTMTLANSPNNTSTTTIDFGDGTVISGSTGSHTYATPGAYTVTATFTSSTGTATATTTVNAAAAAPKAVLSLSATSAVAPATITASTSASTDPNTGGSISGSVINWGDGTSSAGPSASHSYPAAGAYTVTATITDSYGVSSTATQTLNVTGSGVTITSPTNGSSPTSPVQVTATASSGNGIAAMTTYVDYNKMYTTNSASTNTTLALAPGSHLLAINAWDSTGAVMQSTVNFTVAAQAPSASLSLSANSAVAPASITATTTATDPNVNGSISSYSINWGDGSTAATTASASHTYSAAGTYTVTATATDNYGKSATATQAVTVTTATVPAVTLALSASTATAPATITATASATDPNAGGSISSYSINWGDGSAMATTASAWHTYSTAGTYTVTATVTDNYGKTASATQTVTITAPLANPTATLSLSATTGVAPAAISATVSATDPNAGGSITSSSIAWGDGTTSAGPSASHTYTTAGTYTVTATATDNYGKTGTATQSVTVTAAAAGVTITSPSSGSSANSPVTIVATATSSNGVAAMSTYVDDVRVYKTYTATTNTTQPMTPGSHHIVINAWDNSGTLLPSASEYITVPAQAPTASLSLSTATPTAGSAITATVSATDPNVSGSISSYSINWGDGASSATASASHTYSSAGTYTVTATVTDNYGKTATTAQTVTVSAPVASAPTAKMTVSMSGATATVSTSASTAGSGSITSTVINWGDGASTAATSGSHAYAKGGTYTISVTVTNSSGLSNSTSQQVTAAGVVIWQPTAGSNPSEPVHISATAYDSKTIASMAVYLDNNKIYSGYVSNLDFYQQMSSGTHTIVINAWENGTGVVYQSRVTFTAQ